MDVSTQETYARYSLGPSGERRLVQLDLTTAVRDTEDLLQQWAASTCYDVDKDGRAEYYMKRVPSWDIYDYQGYCAYENGFWGPIGRVQENPDEIFTTTWELQATGRQPQTATIGNGEAGQVMVNLGDHVKIRWNGNLDTGEAGPGASDVYALHGNQYTDGWRIISKAAYQDWDNNVAGLTSRYQDWAEGSISRTTLENDIDSWAYSAAEPYTESPLYGAERVSTSFSSGQLRLDLPNAMAWPAFTVYGDGVEYLTVTKTQGLPVFDSVSGDRFGELDTGYVKAVVRNAGSAQGSFSGRLTDCSDGFNFDSTQQTARVDPGETVTYRFAVSFTATSDQKEVSGSCTVAVTDTTSGQTITESVSLTGIQENECNPGERFSKVNADNLHVIYTCNQDGVSFQQVEVCGPDEEAGMKDGTLQCVAKTEPPTDDSFLDNLSKQFGQFVDDVVSAVTNPFGNALLLIDILASLLAAVFAFRITQVRAVQDFVGAATEVFPVTEEQATFILGLVVAVLAGVIVYNIVSSIIFKILVIVAVLVYTYLKLQFGALVPG